jgi:uncharacterized protein YkwD
MMVRLFLCIAFLLTCGTVLAKEESAKSHDAAHASGKADIELRQIEKNIVMYTNEERKRYGLPPLTIDPELVKSARHHAIWMTANQTLQHTSQPVAENIAVGQPNSCDVVRSWMNSSGHRANILSGGHGRIGVAAYRTASGTIYWCQQFLR